MKKHPTPFLIEMDALIANLVRCGFERTPQVKMLRKARGGIANLLLHIEVMAEEIERLQKKESEYELQNVQVRGAGEQPGDAMPQVSAADQSVDQLLVRRISRATKPTKE